jgi:hypothetical protein
LLSMAWFKVCIRISYMSITYILSCPLSGRPFLYAVFSSLPRLRHQVLNYGMWDERWLRPLLHSFLIHIRTIRNLLILPIILTTRFNFPKIALYASLPSTTRNSGSSVTASSDIAFAAFSRSLLPASHASPPSSSSHPNAHTPDASSPQTSCSAPPNPS